MQIVPRCTVAVDCTADEGPTPRCRAVEPTRRYILWCRRVECAADKGHVLDDLLLNMAMEGSPPEGVTGGLTNCRGDTLCFCRQAVLDMGVTETQGSGGHIPYTLNPASPVCALVLSPCP